MSGGKGGGTIEQGSFPVVHRKKNEKGTYLQDTFSRSITGDGLKYKDGGGGKKKG